MLSVRSSSSILVAVALLSLSATPPTAGQARQPLPQDLAFRLLDGRSISMGELRGQVVLLDFWATWCAPCIEAMPHLRLLARRFEDKPFQLLSISVDQSRHILEDFLAGKETWWPHIWDGSGQITLAFGVETFPTYLIVDHEGRIASGITGWGSHQAMLLARQVGAEVAKAQRAAKRAREW